MLETFQHQLRSAPILTASPHTIGQHTHTHTHTQSHTSASIRVCVCCVCAATDASQPSSGGSPGPSGMSLSVQLGTLHECLCLCVCVIREERSAALHAVDWPGGRQRRSAHTHIPLSRRTRMRVYVFVCVCVCVCVFREGHFVSPCERQQPGRDGPAERRAEPTQLYGADAQGQPGRCDAAHTQT